ncbi:dihydrofolate reductase family protein [Myroides sp. WP-1]|uniref:dihydrofolate reductase family protein n=1 Tax=Myroides sp. WP-1 TaxID=2759944 RepID=UPI0015FBF7E8|nr:dihydrofolate reductase [Myroides sp. WP-1]MBB1138156.1 dihydrofolate reductase [Myroides sp. WP-1]
MKVTLIANISANGKVLLTNNTNYHEPREALLFFIQYANQIGNIIIGRKTYDVLERIPGSTKKVFPNAEVVMVSESIPSINDLKVVNSAAKAMKYLKDKGFKEILVGGGTAVYNLFLDQELVTDLIFNYIPILVGNGGILGESENLSTVFSVKEKKMLTSEILQVHYTRK